MTTKTHRRTAVYVRISKDRTGAGLGVERQEADCRELAERLGWTVVEVFADNDLSAYSGKPRPAYRAMLKAVADGRVDAIVTWHGDRLHRRPAELEEFISLCEKHGTAVQTVKAGEVDLSTPSGRAVARTLGAWARHEVEHAIERQLAAKAQAAEAGRWRGGRRPYGFEPDGVTVRVAEAQIVAELAERVLAGETLHALARDLNKRDVTTSTGAAWRSTEVRSLLLRARNAGIIEHGGREYEASWGAIVDPDIWRELRRLLTDESRRLPRSHDLRYLGSGVYLCGLCGDGTTMLSATGKARGAGGGRVPSYRCRVGGQHVSRVAEPLDAFVESVVLERLSRPDAHLLLVAPEGGPSLQVLRARRGDRLAKLDEWGEMFDEGTVTRAQLENSTKRLRGELENIEAQISAATSVSPLSGYADAEDVVAAWKGAPVSRRKAIIRELMTVTLLPAPKGRPKGWKPGDGYFDPRYVRIDWRR